MTQPTEPNVTPSVPPGTRLRELNAEDIAAMRKHAATARDRCRELIGPLGLKKAQALLMLIEQRLLSSDNTVDLSAYILAASGAMSCIVEMANAGDMKP